MGRKDYPNHRIETLQIMEEQNEPLIYAAANYESSFRLTRRDFLKDSVLLAGIVTLVPLLLQGCATMNVKVRVPRKVRVKKGTHLLGEPNGKTVRITEEEEVLDFIEEKGDFVKVKSNKDSNPLWVAKMEAIYEDFTETTQPCGTPIPPGYRCTCNCVPVSTPRTTSRTYCKCNQVCTCNLIPVYR